MCVGVRRAIGLAVATAGRGELTILGELVHNATVLDDLRRAGIRTAVDPDEVETPTVMITAHGASARRVAALRARGLRVVDGACPLVVAAHRAVATLVADGYHPVVVGRRDHVEVRGLTEDLAEFDVVLTADDVRRLDERPRFGVVAQTTQQVAHVRRLASLVRGRFPGSEVRLVDTVCQSTKLRQQAAVDLARTADVVVVVGGAHSNNTRELVASCQRHCSRVFHVERASDVRSEWCCAVRTIGLTAGTSTPDATIDEVERCLERFAEDHGHFETRRTA